MARIFFRAVSPPIATLFPYTTLFRSRPPERFLNVALVQPSIPQTLIWNANENSNRFRKLIELSERALATRPDVRSEEHTSELQSHSDLVCRLLLEKKKKNRGHTSR